MDAVDGVVDDVVDDDVDVGYAGDAVVSVDDGSCDVDYDAYGADDVDDVGRWRISFLYFLI